MGYINIAIDGPAGAGKSTIAKLIANKLKINYVDTGAMYRTMALFYFNNSIDGDNHNAVREWVNKMDIDVKYIGAKQHMYLEGEDVTHMIRTQEVGSIASKIAVVREVREKLVEIQRNIAETNNVIMDGRDIGTYVLPNASLKIYLTASVDVRAKRRYDELVAKGDGCDIDDIKEQITVRDNRDMSREFAPLKKADDAIEVDTSGLDIQQVVEVIYKLID